MMSTTPSIDCCDASTWQPALWQEVSLRMACIVPTMRLPSAVEKMRTRSPSPARARAKLGLMARDAAFRPAVENSADLGGVRRVDHRALLAEDADAVDVLVACDVLDDPVYRVGLVLEHHEMRAAYDRVRELHDVGNRGIEQILPPLLHHEHRERGEHDREADGEIQGDLELEGS